MTFTNTLINRKLKNRFFRFMIFMVIFLTLMSCLDDIFKQHKYFLNANTALSKTDTSSQNVNQFSYQLSVISYQLFTDNCSLITV